jgi:histone deacetylase complex regulatory component SIN3
MTVTPRTTTPASATPSVATTEGSSSPSTSSSAAASTPKVTTTRAALSVAASPYARMFQNPSVVSGTGTPISSSAAAAAASAAAFSSQQRSGMSKGFGMGHQPQSLADALAFTNKLRQGFSATKHGTLHT